jgi:hypothetical protein
LSTKALADLSQQNNLSGSLREEAQNLARMLRASLGEEVLVPPPAKASRAPAPTRRTAQQPPVKGAAQSSGDYPFGSLK